MHNLLKAAQVTELGSKNVCVCAKHDAEYYSLNRASLFHDVMIVINSNNNSSCKAPHFVVYKTKQNS